jgi:hypothetical protein
MPFECWHRYQSGIASCLVVVGATRKQKSAQPDVPVILVPVVSLKGERGAIEQNHVIDGRTGSFVHQSVRTLKGSRR